MQLSIEQIETYKHEGFILIKDFFAQDEIQHLKAAVHSIFLSAHQGKRTQTALRDSEFSELLVDLFANNFAAYHGAAKCCNHLIEFHQLSFKPSLLSLLQQLGLAQPITCARPLMWFHHTKLARSERYHRLPAHQEWSNMQGSLNGVAAWSPLVSISEEMGRLQLQAKSHLQGLLPYSDDSKIEDAYPFEILPADLPTQPFIEANVAVTDLLVFSAFLIHRSGHNTTDNVRLTFNFRYNDLACQSFIKRHYLDPFQYNATPQIVDGYQPPITLINNYFR